MTARRAAGCAPAARTAPPGRAAAAGRARRLDVPADGDERADGAVEAVEQRAEELGLVVDRPHRHVHERRLELVEPGRRGASAVSGTGRRRTTSPRGCSQAKLGGARSTNRPRKAPAYGSGSSPCRATAARCTRARLERRDRDHRAEGVVHRRKPERGGRDRRREVAAVVARSRRPATTARRRAASAASPARGSSPNRSRELVRPALLRRQREDLARVQARTRPRPPPRHPCGEQREALLRVPGPIPRRCERDVVPSAGERVRKRQQWPEVPFPGHAAEQDAHRPIIALREEARRIYRFGRDGDLQRATGPSRAEIDEIGAAEARERQGEALFVDVREREEWEEGAVPGALHVPARPARVADRRPRPRPLDGDRPLLLRRRSLRVRREGAAGARLRERDLLDRRLHRLEAERLRGRDAALADARTSGAATPATC